jgi:hypothetical protein
VSEDSKIKINPSDSFEELHKKSKGSEIVEEIQKQPSTERGVLDIEELKKPSRGQKILNKIKEGDLFKEKDNYVGEIKNGVEVVDVKAIEKPPMDKYGLPVSRNRKNWDRI